MYGSQIMIWKALHEKFDFIAAVFTDGADDRLRGVSGAVIDTDDAADFFAAKE